MTKPATEVKKPEEAEDKPAVKPAPAPVLKP